MSQTGGGEDHASGPEGVEARTTSNHPPVPRTAPTAKNHPAPDINNAKVEKSVLVQLSRSLMINIHALFKSYILSVKCKENKAPERFTLSLIVPSALAQSCKLNSFCVVPGKPESRPVCFFLASGFLFCLGSQSLRFPEEASWAAGPPSSWDHCRSSFIYINPVDWGLFLTTLDRFSPNLESNIGDILTSNL